MASTAINNYITKRYARWLDYASYHCMQAGMPEQDSDVLNEVLCSLLQKPNEYLEKLLNAKQNQYTELDFYVLRMIKLNATSPTSPYQSKYKFIDVDRDTDYSQLEIEYVTNEAPDNSEQLLKQFNLVRETFEELQFSGLAKRVFEWKFINDNKFSEWPGPEDTKIAYEVYSKVTALIRQKINGESIF